MADPDKLALGQIEDALRGLLRGEHSSLHLSFNDHTANYVDPAQHVNDGCATIHEWVSESERDKAVGLNQVWTLQWYPDTPVGCHIMRASSLAALLGSAGCQRMPNGTPAPLRLDAFVIPKPEPGETHSTYIIRLANDFQDWGNRKFAEIEQRVEQLADGRRE